MVLSKQKRGAFYVRRVKKGVKNLASVSGTLGKIFAVLVTIVTFGVVNTMGNTVEEAMKDFR